MSNYLIKIIIRSIIWLTFMRIPVICEQKVSARCALPAVPSGAKIHQASLDKHRFENKEKVQILCQKGEFPLFDAKLECNNGQWVGKQARCGKHIDAEVIHLDIRDCNNNLLVSQPLNQTLEVPKEIDSVPANSYHTYRVTEGMTTSAKGSLCYSYKIRFERKVQIWFLFVEIWAQNNATNVSLEITPFVSKYRTCVLHEKSRESAPEGNHFRNTFICDLNNEDDLKKENSEISDEITLKIDTNSLEEVGLDVLSIGEVFTVKNSASKVAKSDCGQIHVQNIGTNVQEEVSFKYVMCNESFVDMSKANDKISTSAPNPVHKFRCNANGVWVGEWPQCVPIKTCPQESLNEEMDSSVMMEEIGNVYYFNESKWFAINESFIRYSCRQENHIIVGKNIRNCLKNGQWSSGPPYCTRAGISGLGIAGILFAVLIVFVIIVFIVFRMHSKRVKRELRETRNEIQETTRKRMSDEFYADVKTTDFYDDPEPSRKSTQAYEGIDYETVGDHPRYGGDPHNKRPPSPEYLVMSVKE